MQSKQGLSKLTIGLLTAGGVLTVAAWVGIGAGIVLSAPDPSEPRPTPRTHHGANPTFTPIHPRVPERNYFPNFPTAPVPTTQAAPTPQCATENAVETIDETHRRVHRAPVRCLLNTNAAGMFSAMGRLVPLTREGRVVGVRIFGIRHDSLGASFGLQNGDALLRINGIEFGSTPNHTNTTQLAEQNSVTLDVERRGSPLQLHYELVD